MSTHDFRLRGTSKPLRDPEGTKRGAHVYASCTRCGRERQINVKRTNPDGLCKDCQTVDPNVWRLT